MEERQIWGKSEDDSLEGKNNILSNCCLYLGPYKM